MFICVAPPHSQCYGPPPLKDAWKDCKGAPQPPDDKFKRLAPEGPFDGGRAVVSCPVRCNFCMGEYPVASCVVRCAEDGVVPSMNSQKIKATVALAKQVEEGPQPFQNQLDPKYADQRALLSMCYVCHGARVRGDRSYYLKPTDTGRAKLSSEWRKVTEAVFVFVAIDGSGRTRPVTPRR